MVLDYLHKAYMYASSKLRLIAFLYVFIVSYWITMGVPINNTMSWIPYIVTRTLC